MRGNARQCVHAAIVLAVASVQLTSVLGCAHTVQLSKAVNTKDGKHGVYEVLHGVPKWRLLPFLWMEKVVKLSWKKVKDPHAFVATDLDQLQQRVQKWESRWCGWSRWMGHSDRECVLTVSPFGETYVALALQDARSRPDLEVVAQVEEKFSPVLLGQGILGAALYWSAGPLSHSLFFRLSAGSLGFMLLSVLILIFVLSRALPNKRGMAATFAVLGSTFTGVVHWMFGRFIPTFEQLITNKVALAYIVLSGLVGLAVTYYYDSDTNAKMHTILEYGLKLLGLGLVATSTSVPAASAILAACLVALDVGVHMAGPRRAGGNVAAAGREAGHLADAALHSVQAAGQHLFRKAGAAAKAPPQEEPAVSVKRMEEEGEEPDVAAAAAPSAASPASTTGSSQDFQAAAAQPLPGERHLGYGRSAVPPRTPKPPPYAGSAQEDARQPDSPLVQRGLILNERTGKTIKIGAATYNRLVLEGYTPNRAAGVLTPPGLPRSAGGLGAGGGAPQNAASRATASPRSRSMLQ